MKNWLLRLSGSLLVVVLTVVSASAQCAMCRGSVESSMGNGRNNVGVGLNTGILYLFVVPYITVGVVAYFWYKTSKKNQLERQMVSSRVQDALRRE
jgi:hypothetical protein